MAEMKWRKLSQYCIEADGFKIARSWSQGVEMYGLSYQGQHLKFYSTAEAAKTAAQRHAERTAQ